MERGLDPGEHAVDRERDAAALALRQPRVDGQHAVGDGSPEPGVGCRDERAQRRDDAANAVRGRAGRRRQHAQLHRRGDDAALGIGDCRPCRSRIAAPTGVAGSCTRDAVAPAISMPSRRHWYRSGASPPATSSRLTPSLIPSTTAKSGGSCLTICGGPLVGRAGDESLPPLPPQPAERDEQDGQSERNVPRNRAAEDAREQRVGVRRRHGALPG